MHMSKAADRIVRLGDLLVLSEDSVEVRPECLYPQVGVRGFGAGLFPKPAVAGSDTTYRYFNRLFSGAIVLSQMKGWEGAIAVCENELAGRSFLLNIALFAAGRARPIQHTFPQSF